jgi:hypothetical protein
MCRYLINKGYICTAKVESDLAILCLAYLSLLEFETSIPENGIKEALLREFYAFSDYAISFWGLHVEAGISKMDKDNPNEQEHFGLLTECLDVILSLQWASSAKAMVFTHRTPDTPA